MSIRLTLGRKILPLSVFTYPFCKLNGKIIMLAEYLNLVGKDYIAKIREKARMLQDKSFLHINATKYGGGVAEILKNMVALMEELGLDVSWNVFSAPDSFFEISKKIHNAVQGNRDIKFSQEELKTYLNQGLSIYKELTPDADYVIIHDPQPAPTIKYAEKTNNYWIWRCHIDSSDPNPQIWDVLKEILPKYDALIFHKKEFAKANVHDFIYTMPPSINPFAEKNKEMSEKEVKQVISQHVPVDLPILTQVSRFDPWKDPIGVVDAYRKVRKKIDCRLVFIGSLADDDPEGKIYLEKLQDYTKGDPKIHIFSNLDGFHDTEVNAFQRGSDIVFQKSLKEGFGLTVAEAMWKKTPVIGGNVGGIQLQITDGEDGFLVDSIEEAAEKCIYLLSHPDEAKKMGENAQKKVKNNFLLVNHLENYLNLFLKLKK